MTPRERMDAAMRPASSTPDRVPVMCQLAIGHYFLNTNIPPAEIWYDSNGFADALVTLQRRYEFDGILVNLPGRDPDRRDKIPHTIIPSDDNPRTTSRKASLDTVDPDSLFYIEPWDRLGVTPLTSFPPWQYDTLRRVRALAPDVSVHGEVFSPFSQLAEHIGISELMLALIDDPAKVKACLAALVPGTIELARGLLAAGADAILISSAYAGGGFISTEHYKQFVLPFERAVIEAIDGIVYTHTCGAIGDRLELMESSGTNGIDTLDPPPLGTVDLADARRRLGPHTFIKGNIDPVNTVLRGTPDDCYRAAVERIAIAGPRGYILSTACSVPPRAPAENVMAISRAAKEQACVA